jgi:MFS family permease
MSLNAVSWAYLTVSLISKVLTLTNAKTFEGNIVYFAYFSSLVASSLLGIAFSGKIKRLRFLYLWTTFGVLTTLIPMFIQLSSLGSLTIFSFFLGSSVGIGLPSCLVYFVNMTGIEERGRVSGTALLASYLVFPILGLIAEPLELKWCCLLFSTWRFCGLAVRLLNPEEEPRIELMKESTQLFRVRSFIQYFVPWLLFCLVDAVTSSLLRSKTQIFLPSFDLITLFLGGVFCLIGGFLSDFVGRKRIVTVTIVALGLGYATVGLLHSLQPSWLFFAIVYGASWGILTTLFMLVVWADLAPIKLREKYFSIGILPPFISNAIAHPLEPIFSSLPITSTFSLAAFFLFLAVVPLLYAPETLPERIVEQRKMKKYMKKAKKLRKKLS